MAFYICTACGTQHAESTQPPTQCVICEEERQYIPREVKRGPPSTHFGKTTPTRSTNTKGALSASARRLHSPLGSARCSYARITAIFYGTASPRSMMQL